jgi:hypothetical protein
MTCLQFTAGEKEHARVSLSARHKLERGFNRGERQDEEDTQCATWHPSEQLSNDAEISKDPIESS